MDRSERGREHPFISLEISWLHGGLRAPPTPPLPLPARNAEHPAELGCCQDRVSPKAS